MDIKFKTALSVALPVVVLGVLILVYYAKGSGNGIKNKTPEFQLSSKILNKEFILNDSVANAKYGNKVVELKGVVANIRKSETHGIIITFDDPVMGIKCVMDTTLLSIPTELGIGSNVSIKGICIGSDQLIGVLMNQCIVTGITPATTL